jgi:hypothetical protein
MRGGYMSLSRKQREAANGLAFVKPTKPVAGTDERAGIPAIDGTHRTGKRKRGTSVTKQAPNMNVRAERFDVLNELGVPVIVGANMVESIGARVSFPFADVPAFDVARGNEVTNPRVDRKTPVVVIGARIRVGAEIQPPVARATRARAWKSQTRDPLGRDLERGDNV